MRRVELINKITTCNARFVAEVEGFNATGQYHINIHAESFLIPVLNSIYNLSLENINFSQKKNFPAVDLVDFKNRVAFQITSTSTLEKIKDTLEKFNKYKLNQHFDSLYIYILTEKKSIKQEKIDPFIPEGLGFLVTTNILDKNDLLVKISEISSTPKLEQLGKLFEHEFSEVQIELRDRKFSKGYLSNEAEDVFPNLLEIQFPTHLYSADVKFDEQAVIDDINEYVVSKGKKPFKSIRREKLIKRVLRDCNQSHGNWVLTGGRILSFRNLGDVNQGLNRVIDQGTVEEVNAKEYANLNENTNRTFKYLLRQTLIEYCKTVAIEWYGPSNLFRFANKQIAPNQKKLKWKGKKEATKTVIFEMMSKKEGHIICYRNLAFKASFEDVDGMWFIVLNPTWSFTNPGGYKSSRFESSYMSGLKRLENNNSIYNYFRFFSYYLSYIDLFTKEFPFLKIKPAIPTLFAPKIEDSMWKPVKLPSTQTEIDGVELQADNELNLSLFY